MVHQGPAAALGPGTDQGGRIIRLSVHAVKVVALRPIPAPDRVKEVVLERGVGLGPHMRRVQGITEPVQIHMGLAEEGIGQDPLVGGTGVADPRPAADLLIIFPVPGGSVQGRSPFIVNTGIALRRLGVAEQARDPLRRLQGTEIHRSDAHRRAVHRPVIGHPDRGLFADAVLVGIVIPDTGLHHLFDVRPDRGNPGGIGHILIEPIRQHHAREHPIHGWEGSGSVGRDVSQPVVEQSARLLLRRKILFLPAGSNFGI